MDSATRCELLLDCVDHVVDGVHHRLVGERGRATLRRHEARLTLEAFDRVLVQRVGALRDARAPRGRVADLRRAGDAGAVTGHAGLVEDFFAAEICLRAGCRFGGSNAELSSPANATFAIGAMRSLIARRISGLACTSASWVSDATMRASTYRMTAMPMRMPRTSMKVSKNFLSCATVTAAPRALKGSKRSAQV